jgi:hypothetical protein
MQVEAVRPMIPPHRRLRQLVTVSRWPGRTDKSHEWLQGAAQGKFCGTFEHAFHVRSNVSQTKCLLEARTSGRSFREARAGTD